MLCRSIVNMRSQHLAQDHIYRDSYDECQRTGAMVAFATFGEFLSDYETVLELFDEARTHDEPRFGMSGGTPGSYDDSKLRDWQRGSVREPTNILYVAVKFSTEESDQEIASQLNIFCQSRQAWLVHNQAKR